MKDADKLRALIVDDELHARENLRMLLEEFCPEVAVLGDASGVSSALKKVQELQPDVVFLDIRMPSGTEGFDFLEQIEELNFQVVFVTAFKDYAVRAFNANAVHYVLKPIDIEDLQNAVQKLVDYRQTFDNNDQDLAVYRSSIRTLADTLKRNKHSGRFTVFHSRGFKVVREEDLLRLEGDGPNTLLHFKTGDTFLDSRNLKVYESILHPETFCRVHKSHIINLHCLEEFTHQQGNMAILQDGTEIPVARARMSTFLTAVKNLTRP